jgi:anti-sigma factor RsiW
MRHPRDEDLQSYVDGSDGIDRSQVADHLETCEVCRGQLAVLRFIGESLPPLSTETFSAEFEDKTMRAVRRMATPRWGRDDLAVAAVGVAATLLVLVTVLLSGDPWTLTRQSLEQVEQWASNWFGVDPGTREWLPAIAGAALSLVVFGNLDRLFHRWFVRSTPKLLV